MCFFRNTATDAVKQELLFVGQESGKLLEPGMKGEAMQMYVIPHTVALNVNMK